MKNLKLTDHIYLEDKDYHTAGGQRYQVIADQDDSPVALVLDDEGDDECGEIAKLLSSAPKLKKALSELLYEIEIHEDAILADIFNEAGTMRFHILMNNARALVSESE